MPPNEHPSIPLRREYAGVLLKAGRANSKHYDDAKEVLKTAPPDDVEARRLLAAAYLLKGRSIATDPLVQDVRRKSDEDREYAEAEKVADALAEYASRRGDPVLTQESEKMRADVQLAQKKWTRARRS